MDTTIAAHALAEGLVLVTNNTDDFRHVDGLMLENRSPARLQSSGAS
jgi:tRNA(fMet)-specific endonuclease VapC